MSKNGRVILWHLPISHFSEKARWALAYKSVEHERRALLPGIHMAVAFRLTRGRQVTLPVLELDGRRIGDSTAIIEALETRFPEPALYPEDPVERQRALELEDWFDEELGPYMRRFLFHQGRNDRDKFNEVVASMAPPNLARHERALGATARLFTGFRYGASSARAADRALRKVMAALDHLESELGDRSYLVGDRFSVADLTAAALLYPLVLPPEAPRLLDPASEAWDRFRAPLKERRAYGWVEETFARHRRPETSELESRQAAKTAASSH
jgi:glutathione S-transferase